MQINDTMMVFMLMQWAAETHNKDMWHEHSVISS